MAPQFASVTQTNVTCPVNGAVDCGIVLQSNIANMQRRMSTCVYEFPSEGKGHTFESCRVRHFFYSAISTPGLKLELCVIRARKQISWKIVAECRWLSN